MFSNLIPHLEVKKSCFISLLLSILCSDLSNNSTELLFEVYDSVAVGNDHDNEDDDDVNAVLNVDPLLLVDQSAAKVDGGGDVDVEAVTPSAPSSSLDVVVESADKIVALHDDNTTPTNNSNDPPPQQQCVDVEPSSNLDKQPTNDSSSVPDQVRDDEPSQVGGDDDQPEKAPAESDEVDSAAPVTKTKNKCELSSCAFVMLTPLIEGQTVKIFDLPLLHLLAYSLFPFSLHIVAWG